MLVFVGVDAIDLVVGGHDGHRLGLAHRDFEARQIQFAHGALIHYGIAGLTPQLLTVDREMLGTCGDTVALDAANQSGRHSPRDNRIFGIVFEVAPAQRIAFDVHARAKQHVHIEIMRFLAERLAHFLGKRRIPGIGHGSRGREACGRLGCADAEMVALAELPTNAMRTITHDETGNAGMVIAARIPFRPAGKQRCFLYDGKFFKLHWFSPRTGLSPARHTAGISPNRVCA